MPRTLRRLVHLALGMAIALAPLGELAAKPKKAGKGAKGGKLKEIEEEIDKVQKQIDSDLHSLFAAQVETGWYRGRLLNLQEEWRKLFKHTRPAPKPVVYSAPPVLGFRIDAAVASDAATFDDAATGVKSCRVRRGCRVWTRVAFSRQMIRQPVSCELSAELTSSTGSKVAIPAKNVTVNQQVLLVDLSLDNWGVYKGSYSGSLKLLCQSGDGLVGKTQRFTLDLLNTY